MDRRGEEESWYVEPPRAFLERPVNCCIAITLFVAALLIVGRVTGEFGSDTELTLYRVGIAFFVGFLFGIPGLLGLWQAWGRSWLRRRDMRSWWGRPRD